LEQPVDLKLLPSGEAGEDEIEISTPGLDPVVVPVTILPSGPDQLDISFGSSAPVAGESILGEVTVHDDR
jgi:hypothetical protein